MIRTRQPNRISTASMQSNRLSPKVVDTLDLHGYRKAEAIRRLTDFLDRVRRQQRRQGGGSPCCRWVCVVTGSGAHSQNGPVLRNAVENLLIKRKMTYQRDKGSFTVDASSGIVLYDPGPATDTKLLIAPPRQGGDVKLIGLDTSKSIIAAAAATINGHDNRRRHDIDNSYLIHHPLPKQVAQDDALLQRIKFESQREERTKAQENRQEKAAMRRVMSESQLEFERDCMLRDTDDEKLRTALLQSERDLREDDVLLLDILAKSAADSAQEAEEEDRELREVLAKSADDLFKQQEAEERELQAILAKSMEDVVTVIEDDDDEVPPQSLSMDDQDELLIRAMEESLREL